jgi:hypothetical protein
MARANPGLRPGLSSAVPTGLISQLVGSHTHTRARDRRAAPVFSAHARWGERGAPVLFLRLRPAVLLSAVFEDLFRQVVFYLGLIAHHFVVGGSQQLGAAVAELLADVLLHPGVV